MQTVGLEHNGQLWLVCGPVEQERPQPKDVTAEQIPIQIIYLNEGEQDLEITESHPVKFCGAGSCCTSQFNESQDNEEFELVCTRESKENQDNEEFELI
ncbi:hypothetical protein WISP_54671 [Willisornis vidua]|uniref:Uncharacterized protein n=1 Tax=Willisornis vidua TaxID=1566151 RepID=A0ABQ9DIU5_9PASS|nr:hypothetical protein WISP_54671 [Willisornis vidua]